VQAGVVVESAQGRCASFRRGCASPSIAASSQHGRQRARSTHSRQPRRRHGRRDLSSAQSTQGPAAASLDRVLQPPWPTSTPAGIWDSSVRAEVRLSYLWGLMFPATTHQSGPGTRERQALFRREKQVVARMDARLREAERKRKPLTVISQTSKAPSGKTISTVERSP